MGFMRDEAQPDPESLREYELEAAAMLAKTFRPSVPAPRDELTCDCGDKIQALSDTLAAREFIPREVIPPACRDDWMLAAAFAAGLAVGWAWRRRQ